MNKKNTYKAAGGASLITIFKVLHVALHSLIAQGPGGSNNAYHFSNIKFDPGVITYIDKRKEEAHENNKSTGSPAERADAAK
jgi:hypothetical protein